MLSGLYPSQHGRDIPFGEMVHGPLPFERVPLYRTLPERLAAVGYETVALVGKGSISAEFGLARGFASYRESDRDNPERSDFPRTRSRLRRWIRERSPRPFFLFVHTYDLHHPLPARRPTWEQALRDVDHNLGRMISLLERSGLYDSTLFILTADHGSDMVRNEAKCSIHGAGHYEENLRVPLVVKLPMARVTTGRRDILARHVDILPTTLDALGFPLDDYRGPGRSIVRSPESGQESALVSFSEADGRCVSRRAIVGERFKYIVTPDGDRERALRQSPLFVDLPCREHPPCDRVPAEELYDLVSDPFEEQNLLARPLSRQAEAALQWYRSRLEVHVNQPVAYRLAARETPTAPDEATKEALRALGYVR
jgi:arylsulfatase A-like enzyme